CAEAMSPDITAKSCRSAAVSVRWMVARSPTTISSKVRLRRTSRSSVEKVLVTIASCKNVAAAVHVVGVAGDGLRRVAHEEGAEGADVLQLDRPAQRRAFPCLGQQLVEARNAGGGARLDRSRRNGIDADGARPELCREVAHARFQRRLHRAHDAV